MGFVSQWFLLAYSTYDWDTSTVQLKIECQWETRGLCVDNEWYRVVFSWYHAWYIRVNLEITRIVIALDNCVLLHCS